MAYVDKDLEELVDYVPARTEPEDFAAFWADTLASARSHPIDAVFEQVETALSTVVVEDVTFRGLPRPADQGLAAASGVGAGPAADYRRVHRLRRRARPAASSGCSGPAPATRTSSWTRAARAALAVGDTPDDFADGAGPAYPGFMTRGILAPETYYYRRLYTDAVRAVEAARAHPAVDPARVVVQGGSQGGGISLAVAGLVTDLAGVLADVPFLQHFRRATEITDGYPYKEIANFLQGAPGQGRAGLQHPVLLRRA